MLYDTKHDLDNFRRIYSNSTINSNIPDFEFFSSSFVIDFDEQAFEEHLLDVTSHLKDDFSHSSCYSENSVTSFSKFHLAFEYVTSLKIKDAPKVLDETIEEILNFDYKDLATQFASIDSKTSREVCNTETCTNKAQSSVNHTSSRAQHYCLGKFSAVSSQSVQDICEDYDFDVDYCVRCKLFEDLNDIKFSVIVGSIC